MRKLTLSEKYENLGGTSSQRRGSYASSSNRKLACYNSKLHNLSLLTLATIPGLISLGEEIYSLMFNRKSPPTRARFGGGLVGGTNYGGLAGIDHRRDFYAYASESFRPSIRFSPYYYRSGITFALPWIK